MAGNGFVKDLRECNKVLDYALETSMQGIFFSSEGLSWDDMVVCTITDASFCNEEVVEDGHRVGGRSQQGYLLCLAPSDIANRTDCTIHPISWSSTVI